MNPACQSVGLIGVGLLGSAISERLLSAGFRVVGFDLDPRRQDELAARGGEPVSSAEAVALRCRRILLCLPNSARVADCVAQLLPHVVPEALIIDCTTGDPSATVRQAEELAAHGVGYVDATVAGSSGQARRGDVLVIAGGAPHHLEDARELLETFARRIRHVGPSGAGARMKLVINLVLGLHRLVLAEGLSYARACGISPETALEVLQDSPASSVVMSFKGPKMLTEDFTPEARLRQHLKDVRLMLAEGERRGASLPVSRLHADLLQSLVDRGFGEEDNAAIIRAFAAPPT
jgi:3-hydroxyisobutyrate dehydrogenase-like beta-hydroxyacid dehydrogenase